MRGHTPSRKNSMSEKILIIGPAWVGDMVMSQSLFKLLKHRDPDGTIDVMAPAWTYPLLSYMPEISKAHQLPISHGELKLYRRYQCAKELRAYRYDRAILLANSFKSALIPWLANIPIRTGYLGEFRYCLLNDIRHPNKKRYPLMIEQFMRLGLNEDEALPKEYPFPSLHLSPSLQAQTLIKFQLPQEGSPILAISAGAEYGPSKRWPATYYAQVANKQLDKGWRVWLFGSTKDRQVNNDIMQLTHDRCENFAGITCLDETIHLLAATQVLLTNDSGLMHIGAALQKPLVALYGSTTPAFTPPLSKQAKVLKLDLPCQPCFKRTCPLGHHQCMRDLKVEQVLETLNACFNH